MTESYGTQPASTTGVDSRELEVVVVGGGQAALALGYFLARQGRKFAILEAAEEPAAAWRGRWDSLTLFTPARYSGLPGLPFPGNPDSYPGRDHVVAYLTEYARHFALPVVLGSRVRSVRRTEDRYRVELEDRGYSADQVVIATGPFQVAFVPAIAGDLAQSVFQVHSSRYRAPRHLPDGPVLVVGGGNTGFQIAEELSASREVHLSIGSRQTPLPQRLFGRDLFWYLERTGAIRKSIDTRIGRRLAGKDTLIGSNPRSLRKRHGVRVHPRAVEASGRTVRFSDGSELDVSAVIWASGFRNDHSWIDAPIFNDRHQVVHRRGVTGSPGLYFLGLTWQYTRGSALIGWVADDAAYIADQIKTFATNRTKTGAATAVARDDSPGDLKMATTPDQFPTDVTGLPEARAAELVELGNGDRFDLRIAPVAKRIGQDKVRMLAYNGSIPGPTLKVREGSAVVVHIDNQGDVEATVHWHGLRLENRYDGTHETQRPMAAGERYTAEVTFPDPGVYWYHPHIREDYGQEMGLYGNVLVEPSDPDYWPPAHREIALTLDDILIEEGEVAPFSRAEATHSAMGRFGNVLLVGGQTDPSLPVKRGEVVRFHLTNTANTRVFKVALPGAQVKLVGGDSGHVEHEQFVEDVVLAPSERVVIDVLFDQLGELTMEHRTPARTYPLASIRVSDEQAEPSLTEQFGILRTNRDMAAQRERIAPYFDAEPDKTLGYLAEMDIGAPEGDGPVIYSCPMHPEVMREEPGHCPECGMKLLAVKAPSSYTCPMHPEVVSDQPGHCPNCGMKLLPAHLVAEAGGHREHEHHMEERGPQGHHDQAHGAHDHAASGGIEWEDDMVEINRLTTPSNMRWKLVDKATGAENAAIDWRFRVGDQVKLRLLNEMAGDHPMHHPFHIHGAGRFLVLSRDGIVEPNLVWKDTVLVRTGETVDILLDVTNPGRWMAHCHIAEHHESGMMFSFYVDPAESN
jgi:FtsP/CotA-like multicopper oxidase with cupredoxin domain/cation diffusion facilitator CzcD-associated flavoprotein CzcO